MCLRLLLGPAPKLKCHRLKDLKLINETDEHQTDKNRFKKRKPSIGPLLHVFPSLPPPFMSLYDLSCHTEANKCFKKNNLKNICPLTRISVLSNFTYIIFKVRGKPYSIKGVQANKSQIHLKKTGLAGEYI